MKQHDRIVRDPKVMLGKPVIRDTRITVEHILRELGGGLPPEQIIAGHPHLTLEDIRAAQACRLEHDPRFLRRIGQARASLRAGRGVRIEKLDEKKPATPRRRSR